MKENEKGAEDNSGEEFQLENFLPFRLSVASEAVSRVIARQHLEQSGLAMSEWRLLAAIGQHGILSPTAAGERTAMDKVKVSRAASSLVGRGLLKQTNDPDDGRGRLLRLTRKGVSVFAGISPTAKHIEKTISAPLTASEWTSLNRSLGKLIEHTKHILGGRM